MKYERVFIAGLILFFGLLFGFAIFTARTPEMNKGNNGRLYKCDYKTLSFAKTIITTNIDGKNVKITGNVFALFTDPLVMKDNDGNVIAEAGDTYGFISQDDHSILVNDEFVANMCGKISIFNDIYTLKNSNGESIANIKFKWLDTTGSLIDANGNVIATYNSGFFQKDYKVVIYDNDIACDEAILLMMASYVSDKEFDQR